VNSQPSLKIIFAGTPDFAATALKELLKTSHQIVAVYTQPDRPAGRGRKLTASAVKAVALQHMLKVMQPETLRDPLEQHKLAEFHADIMVVAAYGLLLPTDVLNILAGDSVTGVCIMQMEEGLDTGPVLYRVEEPILATDTGATLHDRLAQLGANALVQTLNILQNNKITPQLQNPTAATYAQKFSKEDARIDWTLSAIEIDRKIRAFNPWPTAFAAKDGQTFKVWQAAFLPGSTAALPGTILNCSPSGITVATGAGMIMLEKLQFAGGTVVTAADIFNATHSNLPSFCSGATLANTGSSS
jgi:methionyl-tRNA formyltransferase